MSSIPLPALAVKPVEAPDVLGQYGKAMALKGMAQNQQLQDQQIQENDLAIQSRKAMQRAYIETGGDVQKAAPLAVQYGADPKQAQAMLASDLETRKHLQDLDNSKLDSVHKQVELVGQASQALLQTPPEQRQQLYQTQILPGLQKAGLPADQIPAQVPDDETLKLHALSATKTNEQIDNIRKDKEFKANFGALQPEQLAQINQGLAARAAVLGGSKPPAWAQLGPDATAKDFDRVDKILQQYETAKGTQAQRDTANAIRQQTYQLAAQAAADRHAAAAEKAGKPTADEQRRADLAQNLNENFDQLEEIIKRRPDLFGPVAGRLTGLKAAMGSDDVDVAALETIKHQLGMAQISAHGMRSAMGIADAAKSVVNEFHNSPEATLAGIQAARNSVKTFTGNAEGDKAGPQNKQAAPAAAQPKSTPPPGATHIAPGSDGKNHYTNAQGQDLGIAP